MIDTTRSAFVTGGSSGIGLGIAQRLAALGMNVASFDINANETALDSIREAAASRTQRIKSYACDVAEAASLEASFQLAAEELGPPGLVFNSAGILSATPFRKQSSEDFERVVRVNLIGSRNVAAASLPLMRSQDVLVLVASLAGHIGTYGYSAYAASKFGVVGLGEVLRMELGPQGIRVAVVCPPEVETPMVVEERSYRPAATTALKEMAGTMSIERACHEILQGIERGSFMIVPGRRARMAWRLTRWLPRSLGHRLGDRIVARAEAKAARA